MDTAADLEPRVNQETREAFELLANTVEDFWYSIQGGMILSEHVADRARLLLAFWSRSDTDEEWLRHIDFDALAWMLINEWGW